MNGNPSPGFRVPDLSSCGHLDGEEAAGRWLTQLHWQFRRVGYLEATLPPSDVISSINMLCTRTAATFLDSTSNLQDIIEKASAGNATMEDLKTLEQALKDRFPVKPVDTVPDETEDLTRMSQNESEPLAQYYSRVQNALRKAGGRDQPRKSGDGTALTPAETTLL
ncbi:hypothetical protein EV127DRAFT_352880, partial [Xylaria flabelliformis]